MKQPCERTKTVTETIDIGMFVADSSVFILKKEGSSRKEPYEKPKMMTETTDVGMLAAVTQGSPLSLNQNQSEFGLCAPCEY